MAFSKLLGTDTNDVPPSRARSVFLAEVRRLMLDQGLVHAAAYAQCKQCEPELFARSIEPNPGASSANETALTNGGSFPTPTPFSVVAPNKADIARKFLLPANVDEALIKAAWRGNGNQYASVDFIKVFMGVQTQLMQTTGLTSDLARRQMRQDFPDLWKAANQMPVIQAGANDISGMKI
jgi:hypothetical protein